MGRRQSGMIDLYLQKNIEHVSGSFVEQNNVKYKLKRNQGRNSGIIRQQAKFIS